MRARASAPRSADAATSSCGSRCAARSGRSTLLSPVPCCSSRQSRSATPTIAKGRATIVDAATDRTDRTTRAITERPRRGHRTPGRHRTASGPPSDPRRHAEPASSRPNRARRPNRRLAAEPGVAVEPDVITAGSAPAPASVAGSSEPDSASPTVEPTSAGRRPRGGLLGARRRPSHTRTDGRC